MQKHTAPGCALTLLVSFTTPPAAWSQCSTTTVYEEDFEGGVMPPGWVPGAPWKVESGTCTFGCEQGWFLSYSTPAYCGCAPHAGNPCDPSAITSPAIALPEIVPGEKLELDYCFAGIHDGYDFSGTCAPGPFGGCSRMTIEHPGGNEYFALGVHIFSSCPGLGSLPPFDLTAYAGEVVRFHWDAGCVDVQGGIAFSIDDLKVRRVPAAEDCNANLVSDSCDIASGVSSDVNGNGVPDECEGVGASYCVATPNSTGAPAVIAALGSASLAAADLFLIASPVPDEIGLFIDSAQQAQVPFGNGNLCVASPVFRLLPPVVGSANAMGFLVDYSTAPNLVAGTTWHFQAWFRDPAAGGATFNLSDGVTISFGP